ncbi:MAG: 30S ribosomal protein S12 methylthiotransferase RimO [Gemmatimonadota bacterium]
MSGRYRPPGATRELPVFPVAPEPVRSGVSLPVLPVEAVEGMEAADAAPDAGPRIAVVTLGCDKNTVDSERMMAALVGNGARVSEEVADADVVIVNTCGFIQEAKEQSIETILGACELKEEGSVRAVVAVGCMVQRYKEELRAEIPEVDLFLGLTELRELVPRLREDGLLPPAESVHIMERPLRVLSTDTHHTSHLKISEGCDHACAFCAIPLMRGLHRSQPLESLVAEAAALGSQGVKEINIVSQDTTWYGRDLRRRPGQRDAPLLPDLLRALVAGTDVPWYRLFYMYPSGITREMVELLASEPRILPYLDMPIQHGSDRILGLMRRPERRDTIRERVAWLREAVPDLTLRTTVIVGFPGETEEDFREMLEFLEEMAFDRVGAFTYSVEEGTRAADLPGHLSEGEKRDRLEELMEVQRGISFERNLAQVGRRVTALVDRIVDDDPEFAAVARTVAQAPDVDGVTHVRVADGTTPRVGDFVEVEITDALDYDLMGTLVDPDGR